MLRAVVRGPHVGLVRGARQAGQLGPLLEQISLWPRSARARIATLVQERLARDVLAAVR